MSDYDELAIRDDDDAVMLLGIPGCMKLCVQITPFPLLLPAVAD